VCTSDEATINVTADPRTTVTSRLAGATGAGVGGLQVEALGRTATSAGDGRFSISGVPTVGGPIAVHVSGMLTGQRVVAGSQPVAPVAGGNTAVGDERERTQHHL
jgi:hypothetical protein